MSDAYHHGDLRNALLRAAVELVAEHGVAGLSLREAARRVGVSHAAPYRHFPDRAALLSAIAEEGFGRLVDAGRRAMAEACDPGDRLRAYGLEYIRFARHHPVHFRVMFSAQLPAFETCPEGAPSARIAVDLLFEAAGAAAGAEVGEAERALAVVAARSLVHGFATLVADGRLPRDLVADEATADDLARRVLLRLAP